MNIAKVFAKLALMVLVVIGSLSCGPPPEQKFDKLAGAKLKSVLLLRVQDSPLRICEGDDDGRLDAAVGRRANLGKALTADLRAELERRGFSVDVRDFMPRIVSVGGLEQEVQYYYEDIETRADAILHVQLGGGFVRSFGKYRPCLLVQARLLAASDKKSLYFQRISYGIKFPVIKQLAAPAEHAFPDFDALLSEPAAAADHLHAGAATIAATIAEQLR